MSDETNKKSIIPVILVILAVGACIIIGVVVASGHFVREGRHQLKNGQYDAALESFESGRRFNPFNPEPYYYQGWIYEKIKKDRKKALKNLTRAIELNVKNGEAYKLRADIYMDMNRPDEALEDYTQALKINPDLPNALARRAQLYMERKQLQKAKKDINNLKKIAPDEDFTYLTLGLYHMHKKEFREAVNLATAYTRKRPSYYKGFYVRAIIHENLGDYTSAIRDMDFAVSLNPDKYSLYLDKARIYEKAGHERRALENYKYYLLKNKNAPEKQKKEIREKIEQLQFAPQG